MSQSTATTNLPAGKVHCCSDPRTCGSRAPEAPRLSTTAERFALNTSYDGTAHQRQTTTKKTTSATQQSTARRPTNATARRTPSSKPGERRRPQAAQAAGRDGPGAVYPHSDHAFVHGTHGTLARHRPLPTRLPSPIEPQREGFREHEEPTAILRPSGDAQTPSTYNWHLPSTRGPPPSPERNSRS